MGLIRLVLRRAPYVLRLEDLATARDTDPEKTKQGSSLKRTKCCADHRRHRHIGCYCKADDILTDEDKEAIDMVILATESGIDQSKAAAVFVHGLLDIQPFARSFEMKEACYAATAALDYAKLHVEKIPTE